MATPGMLIMSNMAPGSLEQYTTYIKKAEERGLRNFLVTESFTDSLALAQHLAAVTSKIQVGTGITPQTHPTCLLYTSPSPRDS